LIDHLGSFIFLGPDAPSINQHLVLGISLGGHAAWQVFFNEPRVTATIVIIGCPDYMRKHDLFFYIQENLLIHGPTCTDWQQYHLAFIGILSNSFFGWIYSLSNSFTNFWPGVMTDRARLSKLETYTSSNGVDFLGSKDFPKALISSIKRWDPRGLLFGTSEINPFPSEKEQVRLRQILDSKIKGKQILICSGGDDKLVPYHCAEPFITFLKNATSGWYKDGNVYVEDNVYPGVGHTYSEGMVNDTTRFIGDILTGKPGKPASKI